MSRFDLELAIERAASGWCGVLKRSVVIDHPVHGHMTIRQRYDISAEKHENLDVTFWDPDKRENVTEDLPNSRFYVQVDDSRDVRNFERNPALPDIIGPDEGVAASGHTRVTPSDQHRPTVLPGRPSDPIPVPELPPSEPGRGGSWFPTTPAVIRPSLARSQNWRPGFRRRSRNLKYISALMRAIRSVVRLFY